MIKILEYNKDNEKSIIEKFQSRTNQFYQQFSNPVPANEKIFGKSLSSVESVRKILEDVEKNGDVSVVKYSKIFDGVDPTPFKVENNLIRNAHQKLSTEIIDALNIAINNVTAYQKRMIPQDLKMMKVGNSKTGAIYQPIERVGIYIPGGTAALCSSVIMNALPAIVAGVPEVVVFTPPKKDGSVDDGILVACEMVGVNEIYRVGGVMAIGMMAYGTSSFKKVDKIAGPGNSFVALAKKEVVGRVDIDLFAGPSEILIIADKSGQANFIAADMLAQAEHDILASAILITTSKTLANEVNVELKKQLDLLPRKKIASESIINFGTIVVVDNIDDAISLSNFVAPEHLELCVSHPESLLNKIKNAGAVFMGHYTPEAAGDYISGPSHTLPTSGTGRFYNGVSAATFIRRTSIIEYSQADFQKEALSIATLAKLEQLEGHARSALIRMKGE
jgi:histidinol dehydrogenase